MSRIWMKRAARIGLLKMALVKESTAKAMLKNEIIFGDSPASAINLARVLAHAV